MYRAAFAWMFDTQVHQLYPELLKRLDDSCDDVRKAIVPALISFFASAAPKRLT